MRGWLRYFALNAQVRTGVSGWVLVLAIIAAAAAAAAVVFLLVAAFVWLADVYDSLIAGVVLGCAFALIALIALVACLMTRRRNMERARLELAARSNTSWLDPKLVAVGVQIGQAIGWRRLAALGALAVLAGAAAKEWSGRARFGNSLYAMIPGSTKKNGITICRNPAVTTPTRAFHSSFAPRQRCTMCWLVQLYQMPTLRKLVNTPVNGNSS